MKRVIGEVLREFYENGVPLDVKVRHLDFIEKKRTATVVMGMRRTGKTYVTYRRIQELLDEGIELERIVQINFDDERLRGLKVDDLHLIGEVHAEMFPDAASKQCWYFLDELQNIARDGKSMRGDCWKARACSFVLQVHRQSFSLKKSPQKCVGAH